MSEERHRLPPVWGLALCGGRGSRLGADKGTVDYHGEPQARWLHALLAQCCERAFVSVRPDQAGRGVYANLPYVVDRPGVGGPAAGLLGAWDLAPEVAWLVVAADLPLIDRALLEELLRRRNPSAVATAYRHGDGTPEPLCTVWEPHARPLVAASAPRFSLRAVLQSADVTLLAARDDAALQSVNTPGDDARVRARLSGAAS